MAEETVDALVLTTQFDGSGLDRSSQELLGSLRRFHSTAETLARTSLGKQSADLQRFAQEANDVLQLRGFTTDVSVRELQELEAAFPPLVAALERFDPTGILRQTARQAEEATTALREMAASAAAAPGGAGELMEQQHRETAVAATALANAEENLIASLVRHEQAASRVSAASRVQAEQALRAQQIVAQAQRLAAAAAQPQALPRVGDINVLARGWEGYADRARLAADANERLRRTMLQTGQAARQMRGDNEAAAAALGQMGERTRGTAQGSLLAARNANVLRGSLTALALEATGTAGPLGRLASSVLLFAGGSTVAVAALATIAAIASAWRLVTADARAAEEAQRSAVDALRQRVQAERVGGAGRQEEAARQRLLALQQKQEQLEIQIANAGANIGQQLALRFGLHKNINEQEQIQRDLILASVIATREAAQARIDAARQATDDELAFARQVIQGREAVLRQELELELITRAQFYDKRLDLARQAAAAELEALRQDRARLTTVPQQESAAERTARQAQVAHLDAQIALRQVILGQQLEQIRNEERLASFAEQKRILSAAGIGDTLPAAVLNPVIRPRVDQGAIRALVDAVSLGLRNMEAEFQRAAAAARLMEGFLLESGLTVAEIGDANIEAPLNRGRTAADRLADALFTAVDAMSLIRTAADSGLIRLTEADQRALDSLMGIGETAGRFAAGDIVGGIQSAIQTLGSIFGGESEHVRVMRENNRLIRENNIQRTRGFEGLGGAGDAAAIIAQVLGSVRGQFLSGLTQAPGGLGRGAREELVGELESLGLSFEQLQRLADDFGIEIFAKGRLVGGALEQLQEEMLAAAEAAFRFNAGLFSDERRVAELESRASGAEQTAEEIFRQEMAAAGRAGATVFEEFFGSIDIGDPDALREASNRLIQAWKRGEIELSELGGLSPEDFFAIVTSGLDAADALEQLGITADEVTRQMINVPQGFRTAALAFEAQDPAALMRRVNLPLVNVAGAGSDGAALPEAIASAIKKTNIGQRLFTFEANSIVIQGANKNGAQLFDEIRQAAERAAAAGDPDSFTGRGD